MADIYVDSTRPNDAGDGLSWANAKQTIQAAINIANGADAVHLGNNATHTVSTSISFASGFGGTQTTSNVNPLRIFGDDNGGGAARAAIEVSTDVALFDVTGMVGYVSLRNINVTSTVGAGTAELLYINAGRWCISNMQLIDAKGYALRLGASGNYTKLINVDLLDCTFTTAAALIQGPDSSIVGMFVRNASGTKSLRLSANGVCLHYVRILGNGSNTDAIIDIESGDGATIFNCSFQGNNTELAIDVGANSASIIGCIFKNVATAVSQTGSGSLLMYGYNNFDNVTTTYSNVTANALNLGNDLTDTVVFASATTGDFSHLSPNLLQSMAAFAADNNYGSDQSGGGGGGDATSANQTIIINHLLDIKDGSTAAFVGSTDSLQAIRDRGDAAWTGGGGGGALVIERIMSAGAVDYTEQVAIYNESTGAPITGLTFSAFTVSYSRDRAAAVPVSLSALSAVTDAHTDGGIIEIDATNSPGVYRLDLPDAIFAANADGACVHVRATNASDVVIKFGLQIASTTDTADALYTDSRYPKYAALIEADFSGADDEYTVKFLENGEPITAGITVPTITVRRRSDGVVLVNGATLTSIANGWYSYTEAASLVPVGDTALMDVSATYAGGTINGQRSKPRYA